MKKNYYEILEVDRNASPEIIKKAYTTLAKKYHPDLQESSMKHEAEERLKIINEAYEVLSSPEKRSKYDSSLKIATSQDTTNSSSFQTHYNTNTNVQTTQNNDAQNNSIFEEELRKEIKYRQEVEKAKRQAYYDAYIQDLKNRGYRIRYKKSFKDYVIIFISICITLFIMFLLYQIPPVKTYFKHLYNENPAFRFIINIFLNIIKTFFHIIKRDYT